MNIYSKTLEDILISIIYGVLFFVLIETPIWIFQNHIFKSQNMSQAFISIAFFCFLIHGIRAFFSEKDMVLVLLLISCFMIVSNTITFIFHFRMFVPYDIVMAYKGRDVAAMFLPSLMSFEVIIFLITLVLGVFGIYKLVEARENQKKEYLYIIQKYEAKEKNWRLGIVLTFLVILGFSNIQYFTPHLITTNMLTFFPRYVKSDFNYISKSNYNKDISIERLDSDYDVIVIQSETFFDISKIDELTLSDDVTKYFRKYQSEGLGGEVYVPVIGGSTVNTEFEFLTGLQTKYSNYYMPYQNSITEKMPSLAWDFREIGYKSIAIHNYKKEFYRRDEVYPLLGFEKFISMEDFEEPEFIGGWMSDRDIFKKILSELDKKSNKPRFIFAVTVQNHGPFFYEDYKDLLDIVNIKGLPQRDKEQVESFATGLKYSDIALKEFMEEIKKRDRKTLVVFYGDHLPSAEYKMYSSLDYFNKAEKMYTSDYFIWSSEKNIKGKEDMPIVYLSRYLKTMFKEPTKVDSFVLNNVSTKAEYFGVFDKAPPYKSLINTVLGFYGFNEDYESALSIFQR